MPRIKLPDGRVVSQPHAEWYLHQLRWRWLLDSWEGGEAYRMATYGFDVRGMPIRNLIRHKREYPSVYDQTYSPQTGRPPGTDQANQATDDDYELRRARTPVPTFVREAVSVHLGKIYGREVVRNGPETLQAFWEDVDGRGTTIDQWMADTIAPLLMVLGCLDIVVERPYVPEGETIRTKADESRFGLDGVVASYVLPENLVWWTLDRRGQYVEALVREVRDDQEIWWRYWNSEYWMVFDKQGEVAREPVEHDYGVVPMVRIFDRRRPRCVNIGMPRYEDVAELQREYYNRSSELILSDTTQAHALLQGPDDYVNPDGTIPVGPNWLLPKKGNVSGGTKTYEGFEYIEAPKSGADSIRQNLYDLRDAVDRSAGLTKPAGAAGADGKTVAQSGVSKRLDATVGNDLLADIADKLARAETTIARLALFVLNETENRDVAVKVVYPKDFDLMSSEELADATGKYQMLANSAGVSPAIEAEHLKRLVRGNLKGLPDEKYEEMDAEIDGVVAAGRAAHLQLGQGPTLEGDLHPSDMPVNSPNSRALQSALLLDSVSRNADEMLG